jgi:hypothetical protein
MNTYKKTNASTIIRTTDGANIPADNANTDYQLYLKEAAAGATVLPADVPSPNFAILAQIASIESSTLVPRITREFMMATAEDYAARNGTPVKTKEQILAADAGYQRIKKVDDQVRALRAQLK